MNVAFYWEEPSERHVHRFGLLRQWDVMRRRGGGEWRGAHPKGRWPATVKRAHMPRTERAQLPLPVRFQTLGVLLRRSRLTMGSGVDSSGGPSVAGRGPAAGVMPVVPLCYR